MVIMDVISRFRSFRKYKDTLAKDSKRKFRSFFKRISIKFTFSNRIFAATEDIHMETYAPFYLEYYILMALHIQFAQTALGVQRRYYRLNLAIRNTFGMSKTATFLNLTIQNQKI